MTAKIGTALLTLLLLITTSIITQAQQATGKIKGVIKDSTTLLPLEYATVAVKSMASGKTMGGGITDVKGFFEISGLKAGRYEMETDFVGYRVKRTVDIVITNEKTAVDIGIIFLAANGSNLQNVVVTGHTPVVENKTDRVVYNAANDITSQGGAAIDVLRKVPQVSVDVDGTVELQGNPNIRFLINGKPSSMFGNSLADALASIPASQIKSIEAITSPGAKYDAQGTGGIINIILKDSKARGVNGTINLSAGTRLESGSVGLNIRRNNFGISAYLNGSLQRTSHTPSSQQRTSYDSAGNGTFLYQDGYADFKRNGYQAGLSADWDISKKNNLAVSLAFNRFANSSSGMMMQQQVTHDISGTADTLISDRLSQSSAHEGALDWSVAYQHKFNKDGRQLDFLYSASQGFPYNYFLQHQTYTGENSPFAGLSSTNPGQDDEHNFSLDYAHPINEKFSFETGVKFVLQNIDSKTEASSYQTNSHKFEPDSLQSYRLRFDQKVYAAYISAKFPIYNFLNVSAGLRYEYTDVHTQPSSIHIPAYGNLMSSIILSHSFNDDILKLAYTRRLERADYEDLNPFVNISDPYNITTGNPLLKPEIGNNIELGYSHNFKKSGNLYVALFERINNQDHKPFTQFYPTYLIADSLYENVSVTTRQNIGTEYNSGLIVTGSYTLLQKLNIRENVVFTHKYYANNLNTANTYGLALRLNLNVNYQLPKDMVLEAFGDYRSPTKSLQGKQAQRITYTLAFRKLFLNKKASIGITATNPFNKYIHQEITITTSNYTATTVKKIPFQSFGISFNYKFGKLQFKKEKEHEDDFLNNPPSM